MPSIAKRPPRIFQNYSLNFFIKEAGSEYEFSDVKENELRFNVVKHQYMETCKKFGCTEIVTTFCDLDDTCYGNLHKNLIWGRTKTIEHDGECCDFLLEYKN